MNTAGACVNTAWMMGDISLYAVYTDRVDQSIGISIAMGSNC